MKRDLRSRRDSWFLGKDSFEEDSISYRYALCYALRGYLEKCDYDETKGREALQDLKSHILNRSSYARDGFIEVVVLRDRGLVMVKQRGLMHPLVFPTDECTEESGEKSVAVFLRSVVEVLAKYQSIYYFLRAYSANEWDQYFQEMLFLAAHFTPHDNHRGSKESGKCERFSATQDRPRESQ